MLQKQQRDQPASCSCSRSVELTPQQAAPTGRRCRTAIGAALSASCSAASEEPPAVSPRQHARVRRDVAAAAAPAAGEAARPAARRRRPIRRRTQPRTPRPRKTPTRSGCRSRRVTSQPTARRRRPAAARNGSAERGAAEPVALHRAGGVRQPEWRRQQRLRALIQFDTKGVEFGPWIRRFIAQVKRNWFVPYAAMSLQRPRRHHVQRAQERRAHRRRRSSARPAVESFNTAAFNALADIEPDRAAAARVPVRQGVLHRHLLLQRASARRPVTCRRGRSSVGLVILLAVLTVVRLHGACSYSP